MAIKISREIYRGPRPENLEVLRRELHVDTIISLQSGWYQLAYEDRYERQFPADFGIKHYDLGSSDIWPPEPWVVEKALSLMQQDRVIYLHCLSGVDRTGFIAAVYRMRVQGWSFESAVAEWKNIGRHPWFFWWEKELKKYE